MRTDFSLEQPRKAPSPMEVTDSGIVTDVKLEQFQKALPPMEVTVGGMVTALSI